MDTSRKDDLSRLLPPGRLRLAFLAGFYRARRLSGLHMLCFSQTPTKEESMKIDWAYLRKG